MPPDAPRGWIRPDWGAILVLAAASLLYLLPILLGGQWFASHEMTHPLVRLMEFDEALRGGQFPVRWSDNLMRGFGYPLFNFFPPLSFHMAQPFLLIGASLSTAWKMELLLARFAGALGMYGYLRGHTNRLGALMGALLFVFSTYHASTLYTRGNIQEFTALNFWPFVFWGIDAVAKPGQLLKKPSVALAGFAVASVALTHVLTAYLLAIHVSLYCVFRLVLACPAEKRTERALETAVAFVVVGVIGVGLSLFFTLPAVAELRYCRYGVLADSIKYHEHFLSWYQLVLPLWGHGLSIPGSHDTMTLHLGVPLWLSIALATFLMARFGWKALGETAAYSLAVFALCCFGMLSISRPVWQGLPGSAFLQFPWRLLIPATFWASALGGIAFGFVLRKAFVGKRRVRIGILLLLTVPAFFTFPYLRPMSYVLRIHDYSTRELRMVLTNTMAGEYLPIWVEEFPAGRSEPDIIWWESERAEAPTERRSAWYLFDLKDCLPGRVVAEIFYFPGWTVRIDGEPVTVGATNPYGLISWTMPTGDHQVEVAFENTPVRRLANVVSVLTWLVMLGLMGISISGRYTVRGTSRKRRRMRKAVSVEMNRAVAGFDSEGAASLPQDP